MPERRIPRSGITITRLLREFRCHAKNVREYRTREKAGGISILTFNTKCTAECRPLFDACGAPDRAIVAPNFNPIDTPMHTEYFRRAAWGHHPAVGPDRVSFRRSSLYFVVDCVLGRVAHVDLDRDDLLSWP
jgi:hypothetical protein